MKKVFKKFLVVASILVSGVEANATQQSSGYLNINTGVATGYSFINNMGTADGQPSGAPTNNYSAGANIGFELSQYVALEGGYSHLWLSPSSSNKTGQVGLEDVALRGIIPLGEIFSLYGRLGVAGFQNADGGSFANKMGALYGAGVQWALNDNLAFRVEDWSVTGFGQSIIQLGMQFAF